MNRATGNTHMPLKADEAGAIAATTPLLLLHRP